MKHIKILDIFYGNTCNLACAHCDTRSDSLRGYDPDLETILESVRLANEKFDVENWSVLGGEPLLYKDKILEIVKYIRSIEPNKTIFMSTNGMLLSKNIEWISKLITEYHVWVQVCNHTAKFGRKDKILDSVKQIANYCNIPKSDPAHIWWNTIMKYDSGTDNWQEYLKRKGWDIANRDPNEVTYMKNNYGIHYMESEWFHSIYNNVNGVPKPFESDDPQQSYFNSCPSQFCAFLYNKKVYKCAALGTLRNFLSQHKLLDDTAWQKYLMYKPVDLEESSEQEVQFFADTHYCGIDECSMCPKNQQPIIKDKIQVLPVHINER